MDRWVHDLDGLAQERIVAGLSGNVVFVFHVVGADAAFAVGHAVIGGSPVSHTPQGGNDRTVVQGEPGAACAGRTFKVLAYDDLPGHLCRCKMILEVVCLYGETFVQAVVA